MQRYAGGVGIPQSECYQYQIHRLLGSEGPTAMSGMEAAVAPTADVLDRGGSNTDEHRLSSGRTQQAEDQ